MTSNFAVVMAIMFGVFLLMFFTQLDNRGDSGKERTVILLWTFSPILITTIILIFFYLFFTQEE